MLVTFLVSDWRDTAFFSHSEEGKGSYIFDRKYEMEIDEDYWKECISEEAVIYDDEHVIYFNAKDVSEDLLTVSNCELCFNSFRGVSYSDLIDEFEDYLDWASEL